jgi:hypothetical protein
MKKILLLTMIIFFIGYHITFSQVIVRKAVGFRVTKPLRDMPIIPPGTVKRTWKEVPNKFNFRRTENKKNATLLEPDQAVQNVNGTNSASKVIQSWDGVGNLFGGWPPDTDGDVGINHYLQMINVSFQIWDKNGNSLYGPADNSTFWNGFEGEWTGTNDGDPIALYDQDADRWLVSQFSLPNGSDTAPFYELVAISKTSDPTGEWYQYAFKFDDYMPDYPKLAVWPDAYYMATNGFQGNSFISAGATAFERDKMLVGDPQARMIYIVVKDVPNGGEAGSMLPSDWDGAIAPPAGSPNYYTYFQDDSDNGVPNDRLRLWEFQVDWNTPANSTFTLVNTLNTDAFDSNVGSIKQPGTNTKLDNLSDRLMFRLQYRNFGSYQAMVTNHTVEVNNHAAVRWYELHNTGAGWAIYQQGSYSPDNDSRWMASIALDGNGNIGLEYCVSSSSTYPSIRYTGRFKDDPLGQMTITEGTIVAGNGSQQFAPRWGDYSMLSVDPVDDATFWATNEYMPTTSASNWKTRVGAFSFGVDLTLKVFLEGSYASSTGNMTTSLNDNGYLPIKQPYDANPWNHNGGELVSDLDNNPDNGIPDFYDNNADIVDWVLVELRTDTDASTKVAERSGFVKSDGTVVASDGVSPLRFGVKENDYYIVVKHRNHLPVMSANSVNLLNSTVTSYDFTTGSDKYFGTNGAKQLGN